MELTCWDMEQGNPPIIYQLVMNFVRFMASERVKTWLAKFAPQQPQIGFVFFQGLENIAINAARAGQNFNTLSYVETGDCHLIKASQFEEALLGYISFKDEMQRLIRNSAPCINVPMLTPPELHPFPAPVYLRRPQAQSAVHDAEHTPRVNGHQGRGFHSGYARSEPGGKHSVVVEAGEEAVGEANPREILIGARRWAVFMPRTRWRWMRRRL